MLKQQVREIAREGGKYSHDNECLRIKPQVLLKHQIPVVKARKMMILKKTNHSNIHIERNAILKI